MSEVKKYAEGFRFFEKKDNQPDFVLGAIVINPDQLRQWAINNPDLTSEYKGETQVKFQVKKSKAGKVFIELDTWKPQEKSVTESNDSLPF